MAGWLHHLLTCLAWNPILVTSSCWYVLKKTYMHADKHMIITKRSYTVKLQESESRVQYTLVQQRVLVLAQRRVLVQEMEAM
jgi:hypothetical protein